MVGIDLDLRDHTWMSEPDDGPVVAGSTPPARLPPVAHVLRAAGHDQRAAGAIMQIARREEEPAIGNQGEIDHAGADLVPVDGDLAVNTQSSDAAVGVNTQPQVRPGTAIGNLKQVVAVAA